ncbi:MULTISPECIES: hypothetical protein [unclassified Variovorax]|uniref:hypothetical protein n=1 Tax=unclassified Variovorax TaxID=663243 RepID=UPI00076D2623|nr:MULTISPECIES: hypothetical protein [unclassified Variovorax]KWT98055.1 hypothetical protein APY03_0726 [Variovorax sp. WDL1]PNG50470.1 hypothetical protein CHC06_06094 [Variovorax sp. B2]PNG51343.1 hypothetical protein CHC07_06000 [Variovorax sp. B4]VTU43187.1 hypothetical protein H6P1_00380 [Variovorax sp. PBL-H6]VTU43388.1 hypothetical protein SRS16P1_00525 [Variovorax sp. SRS16]
MTINSWTNLPDPCEAPPAAVSYRTLFDVTGDEKDKDTLLVPREELPPSPVLARDAVLEEAGALCDQVALEYGGVARSKFATEFGKQIHQAMANGAHNAGTRIRAALSTAPKASPSDEPEFIEIG